MANYITGLADRASIAGVQCAIEQTAAEDRKEYAMAIAPAAVTLVCTYGVSTLLATAAADATGRKTLVVRNIDEFVPVMISAATSLEAVYEQGFCELMPGCTAIFTFSGDDVPLYARSLGYEAKLEVMEA